jgi:flagellar biogenesis protein FliO
MWQLIITLIIVLAAVGYAVYLLVKRFSKKTKPDPDECNSCSSDCSSCPMANKTFSIDKP